MKSHRDVIPFILFLSIIFIILFIGLFTPARDSIVFQIDKIKVVLFEKIHAPDRQVFVPVQQKTDSVSSGSRNEITPTEFPKNDLTQTPAENSAETTVVPSETAVIIAPVLTSTIAATAVPTEIPTSTEIPVPAKFNIEGVKYETQHGIWNYCAPTNLSMAMTFWGWKGDRLKAGAWLKPFEKDKNVMFYEMQDFISQNSDLRSVVRAGGTPALLKRLISSGFPVLIEKGAFMQEVSGRLSWMGHYNVITGYDDTAQEWTTQDSYYTPDYKVGYDQLYEEWRGFNFQFMIVYPGDKESDLFQVLGSYTNEDWALQNASAIAEECIKTAKNNEDYFYCYFNRGSTQVDQSDFYGASQSYDQAYTFYANIEESRRPYRIVWYETGPYYAYYYTGRYYDLINLANITIASTKEPYFEETYYWKAMAEAALQEYDNAKKDLNECLQLHKNFEPCQKLLTDIGGN